MRNIILCQYVSQGMWGFLLNLRLSYRKKDLKHSWEMGR
jgi:hypothetical protein